MTETILFAHSRPGIAHAVEHVLSVCGLRMEAVRDGESALVAMQAQQFAALVVDVGLPGIPGFELSRLAKEMATDHRGGAPIVVLVASVHRRTSYKRRPSRLYGADDYVELHHIGDLLPRKLTTLLGLPPLDAPSKLAQAEGVVAKTLDVEGDARLDDDDLHSVAELIVADMVLYNGDRILGASTLAAATEAIADDLQIARELLSQVAQVRGPREDDSDPIGVAFRGLMVAMGRAE